MVESTKNLVTSISQ